MSAPRPNATTTRRAWLGVVAWLLGACSSPGPELPDDGSACAEARALINGCGASVGLLLVEECTGPSLVVAECVLEHADSCDTLATVEFADCVADILDADDGGLPVPLPPGMVPPPPDPDPDREPEDSDAACSDELDNDGDGFIDCDDVSCSHGPNVTVC